VAPQLLAVTLGISLIVFSTVAVHAQAFPPAFWSAMPVPSADAAVQEAVQAGGEAYAGDCGSATPASIGQECSKYVAASGVIRAYMVGLSFSEFTNWVFVEQTQAGWIPISSAAYDDSSGLPAVPWPAG